MSIKQLDRAVYGYLDLCELGAVPELDQTTSGAVALARATSAPTPIRAVIAGHSLRATDAGWSFGRGPDLEATAVELLNFLGGRSLQAPKAADFSGATVQPAAIAAPPQVRQLLSIV